MVLNLAINTKNSDLLEKLKDLKEKIQEKEFEKERQINLSDKSGLTWNLQRTGTGRYPYVLKYGDLTLLLSSRDSKSPIPSGRLEIGSVSCQNDIVKVYQTVKNFLYCHRITLVSNSVSRFDLCADVLEASITDPVLRIYDDTCYVSRARWNAIYKENRRVSGIQLGKSVVVLRIYDKILELSKPENSEKLKFFAHKWGYVPQSCTRVEYQLRKDFLNEVNVETFEQCLEKADEIWNYLTNIWFRHCESPVDRDNRNQSNVDSSTFWKIVQSITRLKDTAVRVATTHVQKSLKQLNAQIRGLLTTIVVGHGHQYTDFFGVICTVKEIIEQEIVRAMDAKDWKTVFETRQRNTILKYDDFNEQKPPVYEVYQWSRQGELFASM